MKLISVHFIWSPVLQISTLPTQDVHVTGEKLHEKSNVIFWEKPGLDTLCQFLIWICVVSAKGKCVDIFMKYCC